MDIHGYVIVHKITAERWGQVFNSIGGAKSSYNSNAKQRYFYGHECVLWDAQKEYEIKPLIIWDEKK